MSNEPKQTKPWFTAEEIALACGCEPEKVAALVRQNHWPRVHGGDGAKYGVEIDAVHQALGSSPATVHGSLPSH